LCVTLKFFSVGFVPLLTAILATSLATVSDPWWINRQLWGSGAWY